MSYFNAGHHLPIYQVSEYLRSKMEGLQVDCYDFSVKNITWRDIIRVIEREYNLIEVLNDFDGVDTLERFIYYIRKLTPQTKIMTFGRLSVLHSKMFESLDVDCIGCSGDYEQMVASFYRYMSGDGTSDRGIIIRDKNGMFRKGPPGRNTPPEEWGHPDITEMPLGEYADLYTDDNNKFCGLPNKIEFVVQATKGCPYNCGFCDVQLVQGKKERRISVDELWDYLERSYAACHFDYVSFYSAVFTLNRNWVLDFCKRNQSQGVKFHWKCVTTIDCLDEELIEEMGRSGCLRIGIGLESLLVQTKQYLIKSKHVTLSTVRNLAEFCHKNGIELNCYIMVGFPGESSEDIINMLKQLKGITYLRVRPTVYTPYEDIKMYDNIRSAYRFNRQIMTSGIDSSDEQKMYKCLYRDQNYNKSIYS